MNNLICHKKQNKVYLNNLHKTSFPKSPKTLILDKPLKSYKQYKNQGSKNNKKDLTVRVKGPNLKSNENVRLNLPGKLHAHTLTCGVALLTKR